jgi:hypothetical protein
MRDFVGTAVIAGFLALLGIGPASAASLTNVRGVYPFFPGPVVIQWDGGGSGMVHVTVDRKIGTGGWTQPFGWLKVSGGSVTLSSPPLGAWNIPNSGTLSGFVAPGQPLWQCGLNVWYRVVVSRASPGFGYAYGRPYQVDCGH